MPSPTAEPAPQPPHPPVFDTALIVLASVFSGSLVIAAVLASKIIAVAGLVAPAGVLAYSLTFVVTDVISEVWGKDAANRLVRAGFFALACAFVLIRLALWWPAADWWQAEPEFRAVLGTSTRIIAASLAAYLISQTADVWLFHELRRRTGRRHLWLRNNLSTALSQTLDTAVFVTVAFLGVAALWPLVVGQLVVKLAIALVDTPVVYLLVGWLRSRR